MAEELIVPLIYSPASLISIFNSLTITKEEKKLVRVKGVYIKTGKDAYSGFFYDRLKDESSDFQITLIVSSLLRNQLTDNKTIEIQGYITRRMDRLARIELQLNIVELINQQANQFTEEDVKRLDLLNKKMAIGFKDLDTYLQRCIYNNENPLLISLLGNLEL